MIYSDFNFPFYRNMHIIEDNMLLLTELKVHTKKYFSMRLECQNKYFPYGPKSRLIRALLYTYTNKIVYDEILLS